MGITEARTLTPEELAVDDKAVTEAETTATDAAELLASLERQAVESPKLDKAKAAPVVEARQIAEFHRARADRTRILADRAAAAHRLLALADVGKDVEAIHASAAQPDAGMVAALQAITDAYATLWQLADAHNGKVRATVDRARELGAEKAAPNGPRASSAHVTVHTGNRKIQSGSTIVQQVDKRTMDDAVELAIKGDTDAAVRRLNAAHTVAPPKAADRYWFGANGMVNPFNDQDTYLATLAAKKKIHFLTDEERAAYLDGRLHGHGDGTGASG
jgi:hypothetical protein